MSNQNKVSQNALAEELAALRPAMLRWLRMQGARTEVAEDVVQQATLKALEKLHQLREPHRLKAWFKQIIRNAIRDEYKRQMRLLNLDEASLEQFEAPMRDISSESCACVLSVLNRIQPQYSQLLQAICIDGYSIQNAAEKLGVHKNNLSVRLHRAKKSAAAQLNHLCGTTSIAECLTCDCA